MVFQHQSSRNGSNAALSGQTVTFSNGARAWHELERCGHFYGGGSGSGYQHVERQSSVAVNTNAVITVTVGDAFGNSVSNQSVSLTTNGSNYTFSPAVLCRS